MQIGQNTFLNIERLQENINFLDDYFSSNSMTWTFVIKAFNYYPKNFINFLAQISCDSIASPNPEHLSCFKKHNSHIETWWLNYNCEINNFRSVDVNLTAKKKASNDNYCFMILTDTKREGLDVNIVKDFLFNSKIRNVGAYFDCSSRIDNCFLQKWKDYQFDESVLQSLGTSVSFCQINQLKDAGANHYRLGELVLTGLDIITNEPITGLRQDVFTSIKERTYHFILNLHKDENNQQLH